MTEHLIRIIIADNHAVVRKGIKEIFSHEKDIIVVGEARTLEEVFDLIRELNPDIIMLADNISCKSGLEILKDIKSAAPKLPILILNTYSENLFAQRFLKAGASGFIKKEKEPEEFIQAIRTIMKGTKYISPELAENIFLESERRNIHRAPHQLLSDRELEVFRFLMENKTITEIADIFFLSVKTISTYKLRIFKKLNVKNLDDLKKYADQFHLFQK